MIPSKRHRREHRAHNPEMYGWRHQIENFLAKIKEFRAVATRYDKKDANFAVGIHLVVRVVAAT